MSLDWLIQSQRQGICIDVDPFRVYRSSADAERDMRLAQSEANAVQIGDEAVDSDATPPGSREGTAEATPPRPSAAVAPAIETYAWNNSEYAVFRPTPLVSPHNQRLVEELQLLRMHRRLTNDTQSEMAYMRAAAAVKAVPFPLDTMSEEQLCRIKGVGAKMATLIRQYFAEGKMAEAETIRRDEVMQTLLLFTEVYGVGPRTAERAYNDGCRTLEDLTQRSMTRLSADLGPSESLALLPDLTQKMARADVAEIAEEVRGVAHTDHGGCAAAPS